MSAQSMAAVGAEGRAERWRWGIYAATILFVLLGCLCVDHTRRALSLTFDEPNHLAAGLEWWQFGTYRQWSENPPLARISVAALPFAGGMRLPAPDQWDPSRTRSSRIWVVGRDLLYGGAGFEANLGRARLGTFPFYLLLLAAVWALAGGRQRPIAALIAVGLTSTLPALIGHAALATTDVAFTAALLWAVLALWCWFEHPSPRRSVALGAALGLPLLTKFSVLGFFPCVVLGFVVARRMAHLPARPLEGGAALGAAALLRRAALACLAGALITWSGYRFSVGRIDTLPWRVGRVHVVPAMGERSALEHLLFEAPLPMPELFHGLLFLAEHGKERSTSYLFGELSDQGFLWFYPAALSVKTPLPFSMLLWIGSGWLAAKRRTPSSWPALGLLLACAGILALAAERRIGFGIRHVLVVLPLASVAMARVSEHWRREAFGVRRALVTLCIAALVLSQAGIALAAGDTALGYVNAFAARDPGGALLDSDLDWGQDLFALRRELRARGIRRLSIAFFGTARLCEHGLPQLDPLGPGRETTGWVAISENFYRQRNYYTLLHDPCDPDSWYDPAEIPPEPFAWLRRYRPVSILGTSIRLYCIPEPGHAASSCSQR
ncbi:MAG TPA: glycosyltransferase family 39 protein [Polyangiaceae bacterium]|nr:glycosyltransferase family 39 protein [Polyangiaceae bacterium]